MDKNEKGLTDASPQKTTKKNNFQAFSNMKMPSLWDMDKAMDLQRKNMEAMKQAQNIISEMLQEITNLNKEYTQKNMSEVKAKIKETTEKGVVLNHVAFSDALKQKVEQAKEMQSELNEKMKKAQEEAQKSFTEKMSTVKQKQNEFSEKIKTSHQSVAEKLKEQHKNMESHLKKVHQNFSDAVKHHVESAKQQHQDLTQKVKDAQAHHVENLKQKLDEAKQHSKVIAESWQASTKRIMTLMQDTMNKNLNR